MLTVIWTVSLKFAQSWLFFNSAVHDKIFDGDNWDPDIRKSSWLYLKTKLIRKKTNCLPSVYDSIFGLIRDIKKHPDNKKHLGYILKANESVLVFQKKKRPAELRKSTIAILWNSLFWYLTTTHDVFWRSIHQVKYFINNEYVTLMTWL